jgi:hypothetical protein
MRGVWSMKSHERIKIPPKRVRVPRKVRWWGSRGHARIVIVMLAVAALFLGGVYWWMQTH